MGDPSSYRPVGKHFEPIIYNRRVPITEREGDLLGRQFGFRKARPTINAICTVTKITEPVMEANKSCKVITLDVKNAFNSANWRKVIKTLAQIRHFLIPGAHR